MELRLMLIEEHTLLRYKPSSRTYKLILQNPFEGKVSFKESESERFQLLFNISGNDDSVNYSLKKDLNALRVVLTASRRNPNVPSDNVNVEALNFLYIYAIGAACLVGLTTASGMFFLICWGGSKHNRNGIQNRARESDATKMPLLVSEPTTPRTNQHQFAETSVTDAATLPRYQAEPATQKRWIQSGNLNYSHNEGDSLVTNTLPTRGSANVRPAGILKRPSAGSSVSSAGGSSSLDRTSILNSAPPPAPLVPSSRCSDSNTDLDSNDSRKQGSVASSSSSRPRHIARDFLDESTMSGRTGVRRPNISTVCQPTMVAAAITKGLSSTPVTTTMVTTTTKDAPSPLPELPQFEPGIGLDWYRGGLSSAQGSDETSGIISDSDVSSLERQQQSQSSTSSSNNKLSSSLGGASTISSERFISLDSNDERYIALNVPASTPTPEIPPSSAASSGVGSDTPKIDMTIPRRSSAGTATVTSSNPSTPTLRPMAGSYTSSSTLSSASSVQTVLAADDVMGSNGGQMVTSGTSSLGRPFRQGISPVPPKRSVSLKGSTSFGEGGLEHAGEEEDGDFPLPPPPSTATSPRSALKGSRPPGPPINKQLRFTTITLLALMFLVSCAFGAMVKQSRKPVVGVTIFLPKSLMKSSRELESILLLLNRTSRTEVELGNYPRERVQIFDMVDAGHFTSTEECNSRYSCQHNCDHGLGYKCICERGYELMDSVRCKDTNECLRGNQPCMENRKKCTNLPGHYACDCPLEAKGLACGDCGSLCKPGFYIWQNCTENQPRVCKACSTCHTGSFVARACRTNANTECKGAVALGAEMANRV